MWKLDDLFDEEAKICEAAGVPFNVPSEKSRLRAVLKDARKRLVASFVAAASSQQSRSHVDVSTINDRR